jgi:RNA polymerase sigma-70 factor (ECF subfamily)
MTNEIDQAQFTQTYRELLPAISRYLSRRVPEREVEDLAAQTFEIAWRKRHEVTAGEELPWLYKIASFQVANYRRKHQSAVRYLVLSLVPESAPSAESLAIFDLDLAAAWRTLSSAEQSLLALVVFEGLSVQEAATASEISANAASIRLHRARKKLADQLATKD